MYFHEQVVTQIMSVALAWSSYGPDYASCISMN